MAGIVKLNKDGINNVLRKQVAADLERRAHAVAAAAGPGHEVVMDEDANRARAVVVQTTAEAMRAEATSRRLTRAVDAAR